MDVVDAPFTVISPLTPRRCTFSTTSRSMADVLATNAFAFCLLSGQCLCRKNEAEPLADRQPGHLSWLSFFVFCLCFASSAQIPQARQNGAEDRDGQHAPDPEESITTSSRRTRSSYVFFFLFGIVGLRGPGCDHPLLQCCDLIFFLATCSFILCLYSPIA